MNAMPGVVRDYIRNQIARRDPDKLLLIAEDPAQAKLIATDACADCRHTHYRPQQAHEGLSRGTRYDFAIVIDALETMTRTDAERLLGRLRDFNAGSVLAAINIRSIHDTANAVWEQSDLIALGFSRCKDSRHLAEGWRLYRYDIHDYKHTPSWLNARYWANPERWGKKRW